MRQGGRLADSGNETVSHPLPTDHDTASVTGSGTYTGRMSTHHTRVVYTSLRHPPLFLSCIDAFIGRHRCTYRLRTEKSEGS